MCRLDFYLMESEGLISNDNTINIILLLDNRTDYDWPDVVHIKGKDSCKVTQNVDYIIPNKMRSCTVRAVKFSFQPPCVDKLDDEIAVFELQAIEPELNKKYFSDEIRVSLKRKKPASLFNLCKII